jgi:hypothetical protein
VGLSKDELRPETRADDPATQRRLREVVEILACVSPWAGSDLLTYAWYRLAILPGFETTAMHFVADGRADCVLRHLDRLQAGGYA